MRIASEILLSESERKVLLRLRQGRSTPIRLKERAAIVLLASEGLRNDQISERLGQDKMKVGRWRNRYTKAGLEGITKDKTRPGRIPSTPARVKSLIIKLTVESKPMGATHWSRTLMAKEAGVSPSTVGRIWRAHGLKPHLLKGFKLSRDVRFQEKLEDIAGLYLNPPENAVVFSCDEKSQIQALDRTQPGLPLKKGRCQTMTHDYKRNGTTSLFAALDVATGQVLSQCMSKHRHQEWLRFLRMIDQSVPAGKSIHVICDNYATHKHAKVQRWIQRRPRFHIHFTPTGASWLNMVERFFRGLADKSIRRGVFTDVQELVAAIQEYIRIHNHAPKPFIWTAKANDILEKVKRGRRKLDNIQSA